MEGTYRLADVNIRITSIFPLVQSICKEYKTAGSADFAVETNQQKIDFERSRSIYPGCSDAYLETLAAYRGIAERMPEYDTVLFHGSAIAAEGAAYIFTAKSGTGKSTHTGLWREMLGDRAVMVNDDKPLIKIYKDGTAIVYGTPWDGKHHLSNNITVPVRAVCILERAEKNHIQKITRSEAMPVLLQQTYRPANPGAMMKTMALLDRMDVKYFRLFCNMDISAAQLSYNIMKG